MTYYTQPQAELVIMEQCGCIAESYNDKPGTWTGGEGSPYDPFDW